MRIVVLTKEFLFHQAHNLKHMSLIKTSVALAQLDNFLNLRAKRSDREKSRFFRDHVHRFIGIEQQFPQDHNFASNSPGSNLSQMSFVSYND